MIYKVHNYSWGGHGDYAPRVPKNVATSLTISSISHVDFTQIKGLVFEAEHFVSFPYSEFRNEYSVTSTVTLFLKQE